MRPDTFELNAVGGGTVLIGRVFYWGGVIQTIQWAGELAYEAGHWVGENS